MDDPKTRTERYFNVRWSISEAKEVNDLSSIDKKEEEESVDTTFHDTSAVDVLPEAISTVSGFYKILQAKKNLEKDIKAERHDIMDQSFHKEERKLKGLNKPSLQDHFDEKVPPVNPLDTVQDVVHKAQLASKIFDEQQRQKQRELKASNEFCSRQVYLIFLLAFRKRAVSSSQRCEI